jgi:hypothetical protein
MTPLLDTLARPLRNLRLSVTDRMMGMFKSKN